MNQVIGESDQGCAVGVHEVDLVISVAVGGEGDAPGIRRPCGAYLGAGAGREPVESAAVQVKEVDVQGAVPV